MANIHTELFYYRIKMRAGHLRTSHDQRRRSSLAVPQPDHMLYMTKAADGSNILKRRSSNPGIEQVTNLSSQEFNESYRRLSASNLTVPPGSFPRRRSSAERKPPLKQFDTNMDLRVSSVIWIGLIVLAVIVTVIVVSMLLRNYFQSVSHG